MGRSISPFRPPAAPPSNTQTRARAHTHSHTHLGPEGGPGAGGGRVCPRRGFVWCVNLRRPASAPGGSLSRSQRLSL